jgi:hypothetical protein
MPFSFQRIQLLALSIVLELMLLGIVHECSTSAPDKMAGVEIIIIYLVVFTFL